MHAAAFVHHLTSRTRPSVQEKGLNSKEEEEQGEAKATLRKVYHQKKSDGELIAQARAARSGRLGLAWVPWHLRMETLLRLRLMC